MLSNILIYNKSIYEKVNARVATDGSYCIPYFGRAAAIAAFTECDGWIDELCGHLRESIAICEEFFKKELPKLKVIHQEGTYLMWVDCRDSGFSEQEICERFRSHKVPVNGGSMFGKGGEGFIRVNIALPHKELKIALERMKAALS